VLVEVVGICGYPPLTIDVVEGGETYGTRWFSTEVLRRNHADCSSESED